MFFSKELLTSPYTKGQVLINGGSGTLVIKISGWYKVECVAGGGGGAVSYAYSSGGNAYMYTGGGSGSAFAGELYIKKGSYTYSTGSGGNGKSSPGGIASANAGTNSYIENVITCYAGSGGYSDWYGAYPTSHAGAGGEKPDIDAQKKNEEVNTAGNGGGENGTVIPASTTGGKSKYNDAGSGGGASNLSGYKGGDGMLKITFVRR